MGGSVFDAGITTIRAIQAIRAGKAPLKAGPSGAMDNGNGSLMRVLPLALWHTGSDEELVRDAQLQSSLTHGHLRSKLCCALYCLWARRILAQFEDAWEDAVATLRAICRSSPAAIKELEEEIKPDSPARGKGSGYVVDCLHSARMALSASNYEDVVRGAIALGDDTDTTACVAGGIAGIRDGIDAIPSRWRTKLRGRDLFEPLVERLIKVRTEANP